MTGFIIAQTITTFAFIVAGMGYDLDQGKMTVGYSTVYIWVGTMVINAVLFKYLGVEKIGLGSYSALQYTLSITSIWMLVTLLFLQCNDTLHWLGYGLFFGTVTISVLTISGYNVQYAPEIAIIGLLVSLLKIGEKAQPKEMIAHLSLTITRRMRKYSVWWVGALLMPFGVYITNPGSIVGFYLLICASILIPQTYEVGMAQTIINLTFCFIAYYFMLVLTKTYAGLVVQNSQYVLQHTWLFSLFCAPALLFGGLLPGNKSQVSRLGFRFLIIPVLTVWTGILMLVCVASAGLSPLWFVGPVTLILGVYLYFRYHARKKEVVESMGNLIKATGGQKDIVYYSIKPFLYNALEEGEAVVGYKGHLLHQGTLTHFGHYIKDYDKESSALAL